MTTEFSESKLPDGLAHLVTGYGEYAKEVVKERAIPGIDGLKPSQRRILYTMRVKDKIKSMSKSQTIAGSVLKLHPHGDASVYSTMVRMVDTAEYLNVPLLKGKGSFGKSYSDESPAAARYTNVMLMPIVDEMFKEMQGVDMVPTYDDENLEPSLLPVAFPTILTNAAEGIAVGLASKFPAFNFHEVLDATSEFIKTGDIQEPLRPDFITKGFYVENHEELKKLMETGRGRIKLRGRWHIEGRKIVITELPYYTDIDSIIKKAREIDGVRDAADETGREGLRITVKVARNRNIDDVLTELLRVSDLQMTLKTNFTVIIEGKPRTLGVKGLIEEWVKFRRGVVSRDLKTKLPEYEASIIQYETLVNLLEDEAKRTEFTDTLVKEGEGKARTLLTNWYPNVPMSVFNWILDMKLKQFTGLGNRKRTLEGFIAERNSIISDIENVDGVILRQLKDLNTRYSFPRGTEVTTEDYEFEKSNVVIKAQATPVIVRIDGKFITKLHDTVVNSKVDGIRCMSDDVISFIDTQGRLLRVSLENLEFGRDTDRGEYLSAYLDIEDDYEIVAYDVISEKKVGFVYSDGFASVLDYNEWYRGKRTTRITMNGVSPLAELIIGEVDFSKEYVLLMTKKGRFGFVRSDFKQKNRTARTKLVTMKKGDPIVTAISVTYPQVLQLVENPSKYVDKLDFLTGGDVFNTELLNKLM